MPTPLDPAPHDPSSSYHEITADARMSESLGVADCHGFECLGESSAPPHARLVYYAEYGDPSSELERRLFIACSASLPQAPKPPQPPKTRKPGKPTLASVAKQASKAAIAVARYEVKPDGTVVVVTGKPEPVEPENPWPLDEFRTKETKQ
jgi:hypothetical protein